MLFDLCLPQTPALPHNHIYTLPRPCLSSKLASHWETGYSESTTTKPVPLKALWSYSFLFSLLFLLYVPFLLVYYETSKCCFFCAMKCYSMKWKPQWWVDRISHRESLLVVCEYAWLWPERKVSDCVNSRMLHLIYVFIYLLSQNGYLVSHKCAHTSAQPLWKLLDDGK